jgi:GTP-binding protein
MPFPIVAIVGLPNVGKSTLFNRILKRHAAVVDSTPGVTRDRHYAFADWNGIRFSLVDTGGYMPDGEGGQLAAAVREQTLIAAEEADIVLFVTDALSGESEVETELARIIRKKKVQVVHVVNKVDDPSRLALAYEGEQFGLGEPFPVSAQTGNNLAELLDEIANRLQELKPIQPSSPPSEELSLAIIGAPNSGKSSLVNRLVGKPRVVVSDIPGTTRDSIDTILTYHSRAIRLIDTAGLRRRRLGEQGLEFYSTLRSLRALERSDVAAIMVDATLGLTQGDVRLAQNAAESGAGVILAINKWDRLEAESRQSDVWLDEWKRRTPQLGWIPILYISALTGRNAISVVEEALKINERRSVRIPTPELNTTIVPLLQRSPPPAVKGKFIRIKYAAQVSAGPPKFAFFASYANLVPEQYIKFVERLLREHYDFKGVPITISFRGK